MEKAITKQTTFTGSLLADNLLQGSRTVDYIQTDCFGEREKKVFIGSVHTFYDNVGFSLRVKNCDKPDERSKRKDFKQQFELVIIGIKKQFRESTEIEYINFYNFFKTAFEFAKIKFHPIIQSNATYYQQQYALVYVCMIDLAEQNKNQIYKEIKVVGEYDEEGYQSQEIPLDVQDYFRQTKEEHKQDTKRQDEIEKYQKSIKDSKLQEEFEQFKQKYEKDQQQIKEKLKETLNLEKQLLHKLKKQKKELQQTKTDYTIVKTKLEIVQEQDQKHVKELESITKKELKGQLELELVKKQKGQIEQKLRKVKLQAKHDLSMQKQKQKQSQNKKHNSKDSTTKGKSRKNRQQNLQQLQDISHQDIEQTQQMGETNESFFNIQQQEGGFYKGKMIQQKHQQDKQGKKQKYSEFAQIIYKDQQQTTKNRSINRSNTPEQDKKETAFDMRRGSDEIEIQSELPRKSRKTPKKKMNK